MKPMHAFIASILLSLGALAQAQTTPPSPQGHEAHGHGTPASAAPAASQPSKLAEGEIRKIDLNTGKVTLKHGYIPRVDMPPMTMVFRISDSKMLNGLKVGDKVLFNVVDDKGQLTVTEITPR